MDNFKPEQFNPSDEKYKEVKDLPEEQRGEFVDVPEKLGGGFVRREFKNLTGLTALDKYKRAEYDAERKNDAIDKDHTFISKLFSKITGGGNIDAEDILHEEALREEEERDRMARVKKDLDDKNLENLESVLNSLSIEGKKRYLADAEAIIINKLCAQKEAEILSGAMEKMRSLGHEGVLFYRDCGRDGCHNLHGTIDGNKVDIHTDGRGGNIGHLYIEGAEAGDFLSAYIPVAIDVGDRDYYVSGKNYPEWVVKAMWDDIEIKNSKEMRIRGKIIELRNNIRLAEEAEKLRIEKERKEAKERQDQEKKNAIAQFLPKK